MGLDAYNGELIILDQIQNQLLVVNPLTAATTRTQAVIDTFGADGVFSEGDFVIRKPDGAAFYTESDSRFLGLNLTTGVASQINAGFPSNVDGLTFQPGTGILYAWQTGGQLFTVNPLTGATTAVGPVTNIAGLTGGMDFRADGMLFMANDATLYTINPTTGATAVVGPIGFDKVSGIRFFEVPEPSAAAVLALCASAALARRRRRTPALA
jgi:hypothetical protein